MKFKREKTGRPWGAALYPRFKTYGGSVLLPGHEYASPQGQVRCVVYATSRESVLGALSACNIRETLNHISTHWSVTSNVEECAYAASQPGVPFIGPLDGPRYQYKPYHPRTK